MDTSFWKGRRVFVTGHTGFKGSWLCLWLQRLSADVVGYSLPPPTTPSLFDAAGIAAGMTCVDGDVRDYDRLRVHIEKHRPHVIFHLAAQSIVRRSYRDPLETYSTNVMGTVNLMESVRHLAGPWATINVTSDKSYLNREWPWGYRETDRLGGFDPYSNSKACSELVTQAYSDSYFGGGSGDGRKAAATARAGNVIGGGDWTPDQLVPDVVTAFRDGRAATLRNPAAVRPWQFVLDCLHGYLLLAERLFSEGRRYAGAWNFGPRVEDALTVQQLVDRIAMKWPVPATWVRDEGHHPHEASTLRLDSSKARFELEWTPRLTAEESTDWVVDWYGRYFRGEGARSLCDDQIDRFERKSALR